MKKEYIIEKFLEFKNKLGIQEDLSTDLLENVLNTTDGKLWFCLGENELLESCNHYIIYGSEAVHGVLLKYAEQNVVREILYKEF